MLLTNIFGNYAKPEDKSTTALLHVLQKGGNLVVQKLFGAAFNLPADVHNVLELTYEHYPLIHIRSTVIPPEIFSMKQEIEDLNRQITDFVKKQEYERAAQLRYKRNEFQKEVELFFPGDKYLNENRICDYHLYIESILSCNAIDETQLAANKKLSNPSAGNHLIYLTPDQTKPYILTTENVAWMSWTTMTACLQSLIDDGSANSEQKYYIEQFVDLLGR